MASIPILVVALVQGWLLYALHTALEHKSWPATDAAWLLGLYAVALLVPVALEILASRLRSRLTWIFAAALAVVAGGLAAYTGSVVGESGIERLRFEFVFALYAALFLAWLIALPFVQAWLRRDAWRVAYPDLFEFSWQNALLLSEAGLFTGVFWVLLFVWAALFKVVDVSFFADLFGKPAFIYPVTSIAFGFAIYLVESREKIVVTLRRHLLGVFSWLLPLVALIAVLFLLALPFTGLAPLWRTGHASTLMLWLQILFIHFLNCAYEDGQSEPRYPAWLKLALRISVFALPVYAALCAYSLGLRVEQHGWTVARVWGGMATFVVALYGAGYAAAALRASPWLGHIARINVAVAATVAGILVLATSPVLDPKRLAAASQAARVRSGAVAAGKFDYEYLRFELGRYGTDALAELSAGPNAEVAGFAKIALARVSRYESRVPAGQSVPPEMLASRFQLYPEGTALDPALLEYLKTDTQLRPQEHPSCLKNSAETPCLMLALDLNGDGVPEILTLGSYPSAVYGKVDGKWKKVGDVQPGVPRHIAERAIRESRAAAVAPAWRELRLENGRYTVQPAR
jgi:hypothetical protein